MPIDNQNDGQEKKKDPDDCHNRHQRNGFRFGDLHSSFAAGSFEGTVNFVVTASLVQQVRVIDYVS